MKRTIVKFGTAALMMGMFLLMPACKGEAAEETTDTTEAVAEEAAAPEAAAAEVDDDDTTGGKEIKSGTDPAKAN